MSHALHQLVLLLRVPISFSYSVFNIRCMYCKKGEKNIWLEVWDELSTYYETTFHYQNVTTTEIFKWLGSQYMVIFSPRSLVITSVSNNPLSCHIHFYHVPVITIVQEFMDLIFHGVLRGRKNMRLSETIRCMNGLVISRVQNVRGIKECTCCKSLR